MKTQQLKNGAWFFGETDRLLQQGDRVSFTCNGRGRGGHFHVTAIIAKVNRKTVVAVEAERSYSPGTTWRVSKESLTLQLPEA